MWPLSSPNAWQWNTLFTWSLRSRKTLFSSNILSQYEYRIQVKKNLLLLWFLLNNGSFTLQNTSSSDPTKDIPEIAYYYWLLICDHLLSRCGPCPAGYTGPEPYGYTVEDARRNRQKCVPITSSCNDGRNGGCVENSPCYDSEVNCPWLLF